MLKLEISQILRIRMFYDPYSKKTYKSKFTWLKVVGVHATCPCIPSFTNFSCPLYHPHSPIPTPMLELLTPNSSCSLLSPVLQFPPLFNSSLEGPFLQVLKVKTHQGVKLAPNGRGSPLYIYIHHIFITHSPADGHLGCSHSPVITDKSNNEHGCANISCSRIWSPLIMEPGVL